MAMVFTVINIFWALIAVLLLPLFLSDPSIGFSNSPLSIVVFVIIIILLQSGLRKPRERRKEIITHINGFILSVLIAFGHSLDEYGSISYWKLIIPILFFTHVIAVLISIVWDWLVKLERRLEKTGQTKKGISYFVSRIVNRLEKHWIIVVIILLVCWLPAFFADFPGGFRYDATAELNQVTNGFSGDFPLLHSVIVTRLFPWLHSLTGSWNTGIAVYVGIQMVLMALMYTHIFVKFVRYGINRTVIACVLLYCGLFPVIQILVVQEVRDVLFGGLLTYLVFLIYVSKMEGEKYWNTIWKPVCLGLVLILTFMARNNNAGTSGLIIIILAAILIILFNFRSAIRGVIVFGITTLGCYFLLGVIFTSLCQPMIPATEGASLSLMSQSITRAYIMDQDNWTEEEIQELSNYMDLDGLKYVPQNADLTKSRLKIDHNFNEFLTFWLRIGSKHFGCYIDAIMANTQDMWFPNSVIDGYKYVFQNEGEPYFEYDKNYYYINNTLPEPAEHGHFLPLLEEYYTDIGLRISFERIPLISQLFSIGFQFWIVLGSIFYLIYRRKWTIIVPILILIYMIISSFAPLVLLRYYAAVFLSIPIIVVLSIQPERTSQLLRYK